MRLVVDPEREGEPHVLDARLLGDRVEVVLLSVSGHDDHAASFEPHIQRWHDVLSDCLWHFSEGEDSFAAKAYTGDWAARNEVRLGIGVPVHPREPVYIHVANTVVEIRFFMPIYGFQDLYNVLPDCLDKVGECTCNILHLGEDIPHARRSAPLDHRSTLPQAVPAGPGFVGKELIHEKLAVAR